jgi:hypothetical protein
LVKIRQAIRRAYVEVLTSSDKHSVLICADTTEDEENAVMLVKNFIDKV